MVLECDEVDHTISLLSRAGINLISKRPFPMTEAEKAATLAAKEAESAKLTAQINSSKRIAEGAKALGVATTGCLATGIIIAGAVAAVCDILFNLAYDNAEKIAKVLYNFFWFI